MITPSFFTENLYSETCNRNVHTEIVKLTHETQPKNTQAGITDLEPNTDKQILSTNTSVCPVAKTIPNRNICLRMYGKMLFKLGIFHFLYTFKLISQGSYTDFISRYIQKCRLQPDFRQSFPSGNNDYKVKQGRLG